jgi:hypothetical protein
MANQYYEYTNETDLTFGGFYQNFSDSEFVESAFKLYTDQAVWEEKSNIGEQILKSRMDKYHIYP